eukprot:8294672-Lingulodinium_polyedra.AAC.1
MRQHAQWCRADDGHPALLASLWSKAGGGGRYLGMRDEPRLPDRGSGGVPVRLLQEDDRLRVDA